MPLDPNARLTGKKAASLPIVLGVEPLTEADLGKLAETRGVKPAPIKRLSARHHNLAKAIASGRSTGDAAIIAGVEPSRVSVLKNDVTFKELIEYYRSRVDRGDDLMFDRLTGMSLEAVDEINRRIEEEPETLTTDELERIAKLGLDRTGYGPKRTEDKTFTFNFGDRLNAARERIRKHEEMLDITPEASE